MTVLVYVEEPGELTQQALAFARRVAQGTELDAVAATTPSDTLSQGGVSTLHLAEHDVFSSFAPAAWSSPPRW